MNQERNNKLPKDILPMRVNPNNRIAIYLMQRLGLNHDESIVLSAEEKQQLENLHQENLIKQEADLKRNRELLGQ